MLGIPDEQMKEIASYPNVEHSWLAQRILESPDLDELEDELAEWLKPKVMAKVKTSSDQYCNVWRIVRDAYPVFLEREALREFLNIRPNWLGYIPDVYWPEEATDLMSRNINWVSSEEVNEATEILKSLLQDEMLPSFPNREETGKPVSGIDAEIAASKQRLVELMTKFKEASHKG